MAVSGSPLTPPSEWESWWQEVKKVQCTRTHAHTRARTAVSMRSALKARCSEEARYAPRWWVTPGSDSSWPLKFKNVSLIAHFDIPASPSVYVLTHRRRITLSTNRLLVFILTGEMAPFPISSRLPFTLRLTYCRSAGPFGKVLQSDARASMWK